MEKKMEMRKRGKEKGGEDEKRRRGVVIRGVRKGGGG